MEINFNGKRAIVTGAAQGIGRGIALKLAQCGATVFALDKNETALENLKNDNSNLQLLAVDLSDWKTATDVIKSILPIDLLVNNAGIGYVEPLITVTEEQYDRMFAINVKALFNATRVVIENLVAKNQPGAIVNISSQASQAGLLHHTLYCATKGAVDAFTRATALEFGGNGIRINCVNPTVVLTDLGRQIWENSEMGKPMLSKIPIGRFAEIDDVVDAVLYLLSDKAKMITGSCLPVDGGFWLVKFYTI